RTSPSGEPASNVLHAAGCPARPPRSSALRRITGPVKPGGGAHANVGAAAALVTCCAFRVADELPCAAGRLRGHSGTLRSRPSSRTVTDCGVSETRVAEPVIASPTPTSFVV